MRICPFRARFRSGRNAAVHRTAKYAVQVPAFLYGPQWTYPHLGLSRTENEIKTESSRNKKASVRKRTKAISLVLTTCYIILGAVCRLLRIWRPLTRELTSALTLAVQYRSGAPSGLRLGSDIRQYPTDAGLAPSPGSLGCSDKTYCLRHSLCYWIYAHVII